MANIPADVVGQAASTAATATQNAANLTQAPEAHWYDVWSQTGSGVLRPPAVSPFVPKPGEAMTPEVAARIRQAREAADQWTGASLEGVVNGLEQQANTIKEQAAQLWGGTLPSGQPMSTLQQVGAAFGLLTSVEQFYSVLWTSWIPFPAFPALRVLDTDVGLPHAHMHPPNLTPPNPVPVPLPSTGPVIPIPFVSGATKTLINGMPAARCGDIGLGVFCGGFFPLYEVFLGSSNVWIEGNRAARVGVDLTKHCIFSSPKPSDPPLGPMFGTTVVGSPNVLIGGIPLPSLTSMAIGAAFKALFKGLGKLVGKRPAHTLRSGDVPSTDPRLSGPALAPVTAAPDLAKVQNYLNLMSKSPWSKKIILPKGSKVALADLLALTQRTKREWSVLLNEKGRLVMVQGDMGSVKMPYGHTPLAHTHPKASGDYYTNISEGDRATAQAFQDAGYPSDQIVVTGDGQVYAFDHNGVNGTPDRTPISPNGEIDGRYYDSAGDADEPNGFDN